MGWLCSTSIMISIFVMTKFALHTFTRGLARKLVLRDITANLVQQPFHSRSLPSTQLTR